MDKRLGNDNQGNKYSSELRRELNQRHQLDERSSLIQERNRRFTDHTNRAARVRRRNSERLTTYDEDS